MTSDATSSDTNTAAQQMFLHSLQRDNWTADVQETAFTAEVIETVLSYTHRAVESMNKQAAVYC